MQLMDYKCFGQLNSARCNRVLIFFTSRLCRRADHSFFATSKGIIDLAWFDLEMMGGLTLVFTVNGLSAETKENDHGARITFLMNPFVFKNLLYRYGSWIFRLGR